VIEEDNNEGVVDFMKPKEELNDLPERPLTPEKPIVLTGMFAGMALIGKSSGNSTGGIVIKNDGPPPNPDEYASEEASD
jgi:hypothetical protein